MKKMKYLAIVFISLSVVVLQSNNVLAQSTTDIDGWIKQLQSQNWQERENAVLNLLSLPAVQKTDNVIKALIDELERENYKKVYEGEEGEYLSMLLKGVAAMRDDRAFPLLKKIGAPDGLIQYGDKGVVAILDNLKRKPTCNEKYYSVRILTESLQLKKAGYVAHGTIRQKIKKDMLKMLEESKHPDKNKNIEWYDYRARECARVRFQITRALGYFAETGDAEVLPYIESLAKHDPYYWVPKGKPDDESNRKYDVRDEAKTVIDELKAKGIKK